MAPRLLARRRRTALTVSGVASAPETMTAAFPGRELLPSRIAIASDEALDCYLERLSAANSLATGQLMRLLTRPAERRAPTSAFLMAKPDPAITDRIAGLGGVRKPSVDNAPLMRYRKGFPVRLDDLDPRCTTSSGLSALQLAGTLQVCDP